MQALSTVWYLGPEDVTPFNGGTFVVPYSHRDPRNRAPQPRLLCLLCWLRIRSALFVRKPLLTSRVQCAAARGPNDGIDERSPIPGEFQVSGVAGSVFMQDTRLW